MDAESLEQTSKFGRPPRAPDLVREVVLGNVSADLFWWVGEAAVYDVEVEGPVLYLTSRERSPILTYPAEAAVALAKHHLLPLTDLAELRAIKADRTTVRLLLAELNLQEGDDCCFPLTPLADRWLPVEIGLSATSDQPRGARDGRVEQLLCTRWAHFHLETEADSQALNPAQRRLAEALFGTPLERYLEWLRARGVYQTKVGALSPAGVVARYGVHGPFAMGARFSEVQGQWHVDGNFLLSCDSILSRPEFLGDPTHADSSLGDTSLEQIFRPFAQGTETVERHTSAPGAAEQGDEADER